MWNQKKGIKQRFVIFTMTIFMEHHKFMKYEI